MPRRWRESARQPFAAGSATGSSSATAPRDFRASVARSSCGSWPPSLRASRSHHAPSMSRSHPSSRAPRGLDSRARAPPPRRAAPGAGHGAGPMNDNALDAVNQFTVNVIEGGDRASRSTQRPPALFLAALNQARTTPMSAPGKLVADWMRAASRQWPTLPAPGLFRHRPGACRRTPWEPSTLEELVSGWVQGPQREVGLCANRLHRWPGGKGPQSGGGCRAPRRSWRGIRRSTARSRHRRALLRALGRTAQKHVASGRDDETRLRLHAMPTLGTLVLREVRPGMSADSFRHSKPGLAAARITSLPAPSATST